MAQEEGIIGRMVGSMIRRSVRKCFRNVYWTPPNEALSGPCVFVANHHGWHDGYLMFHLVSRLGLESIDWIEEFDAFPLFAKVGGRPFPKNDPSARAKVIRESVREMQSGKSLILFGEGILHRPPDILPITRILPFLQRSVPGLTFVPVAIYYEMSVHERPEAWIRVGSKIDPLNVERNLSELLNELRKDVTAGAHFEVLASGTPDVNERYDMRRIPGR